MLTEKVRGVFFLFVSLAFFMVIIGRPRQAG